MFYNADSGLYLTQYRAYDPVVGRWLSRDPAGEISDPTGSLQSMSTAEALGSSYAHARRPGLIDGPNLYAYAKSAPTIYIDITGRNPAGGAVIGGAIAGPPGVVIGAAAGILIIAGAGAIDWYFNESHDKSKKSKPSGCPPGTVPIDQAKGPHGIGRDDLHKIKKRVEAGPRDWVGVSPNGDVWTGDGTGNAVNEGHWKGLR